MLVKVSLNDLEGMDLTEGSVLTFERRGQGLMLNGRRIGHADPIMQRPSYMSTIVETTPLMATVSIARYADLHRHSDNSLLDGICKVSDMVKYSVPQGALTDHGVLYGFLEYYKGMKAAGKKPIIGCEVYVENLNGELKRDHLILLAKNNKGYSNLLKLVSNAYEHMKGGRPHVLLTELRDYHEGLIATSACIAGTIAKLIRKNDIGSAEQALDTYLDIFGKENFYLEIQRHGIPDETMVESIYRQWSIKKGLKVIAATDSHYTKKEDAYAHEVALCLQTQKVITQEHMKFEGGDYHIHTSEEMEKRFSDWPEVLEQTLELADRCDVSIRLGDVNLPKFPIPEPFQSPEAYFEYLCETGFERRFGGKPEHDSPEYKKRYDYEMAMIKKMGFVSYFIIVYDYINFARSHGIYVGPGRGSAAGSLLAYCIGMTDLDPIKLNLLFERFLNPERVSWPDVDTDFEHTGRETVIEYIKQKYGPDHVCHIITFGTEAARMVVKDVGRVLGYPVVFCNALAKKIPQEPHMTIAKALEESIDFKTEYERDGETRKLVDLAMKLEGCKRHASAHACGLVISPSIVSDFLPTAMAKNDETGEIDVTSQVVAPEVEELSLLKMDVLGLKNLTVIHEAIDAINSKYNINLDYHDIPLDDRRTFQFLAKGCTGGVFQLESEGMTKVVTRMLADIDDLPDSEMHQGFERIIAAVALYRPGPMAFIDDYIEGMHDPSKIHYDCPQVESILKPTYGQIVYQEQVMQIVQKMAGYRLSRADLVTKAMGKKKQKLMDKERHVFIYGNKKEFDEGKDENYAPGCIANGISEEVAITVWNKMADFAKYAFNRSHAACYAYIAMITAWLSCYYPKEFYAAMLNAFNDNRDKFKAYLAQANRRGLKMLPPNVNQSNEGFFVEDDAIRFSLRGLMGMNKSAGAIVAERESNGRFKSFQDFYDRMLHARAAIDKKPFEALTYSGALDCFGHTRRSLVEAFPKFSQNTKFEKKIMEGQVSLFSCLEDDAAEQYGMIEIAAFPEFDERKLMEKEHEMIGVYLTRHPVDKYDAALTGSKEYVSISDLVVQKPYGRVATVGMVKNLRTVTTRNEEIMCLFTLESRYESIPCVVFPRDMAGNQDAITEDRIIMVKGNFNENDHGVQIIVKTVLREDVIKQKCAFSIVVRVTNAVQQKELLDWADKNPGDFTLILLAPDKKDSNKLREYRTNKKVAKTICSIDYLTRNFQSVRLA